MRDTQVAALLGAVVIALSAPVAVSAQKTKTPPKSPVSPKATVTKGTGTGTTHTGSIEQMSFSQGAVNTGSQTSPGGGGKETLPVVVPPSGGTPNDSAHKRPPH
jgi:hypothetical protein